MSRVPINTLLSLSRRSYAVAAATVEAARPPAAPSAVLQSAATAVSGGKKKEEIFWMRDPKTGNWIPENRFEEIDAADLRAQFLPKK